LNSNLIPSIDKLVTYTEQQSDFHLPAFFKIKFLTLGGKFPLTINEPLKWYAYGAIDNP